MLKPVEGQGCSGLGRMWWEDGYSSSSGVLECPEKPGGDMPTPLSLRQDGSLGGEGQATFLAEAGILTSDFPCSPVGEEPALSQKCRVVDGGGAEQLRLS